jgi:hypothetical protein
MSDIKEDAPGNATGAAVAGTGGGVHWSKKQPKMGLKGTMKKYGQPILFKTLRRKKPVTEESKSKSVYYKILKKRVPAASRTSAMGDGSDGSE